MMKLPRDWYRTPEGRTKWIPIIRANDRLQKELLEAKKRAEEKAIRDAGIEATIRIVEERGKRIQGAIQPDRTIEEIREKLDVRIS